MLRGSQSLDLWPKPLCDKPAVLSVGADASSLYTTALSCSLFLRSFSSFLLFCHHKPFILLLCLSCPLFRGRWRSCVLVSNLAESYVTWKMIKKKFENHYTRNSFHIYQVGWNTQKSSYSLNVQICLCDPFFKLLFVWQRKKNVSLMDTGRSFPVTMRSWHVLCN